MPPACLYANQLKMKVTDFYNGDHPVFSFEILPPLKGNSIYKIYDIVDSLREFDPKFINITSHHSEYVYKPLPNGTHKRVSILKRPGTVAIAAALQNHYGIATVPHIICRGFSKDETEYALLDLNFLGIHNLFLVRGDDKTQGELHGAPEDYHEHASGLQHQVNDFNLGKGIDDTRIQGIHIPFSYGMACYPEKHEEAPNFDSDIHYMKKKQDEGAEYFMTQMFFNNDNYYSFLERCRKAGITVPVIPALKPISKLRQLNVLPKVFRTELPEALASELRKAKTDAEASRIGVEWCVEQSRDLLAHGAPGIHYYTMSLSESVAGVVKKVF